MDHLQAITLILEKCEEYQIPLFMAFVDYEKAFDFTSHGAVFSVLERQGVPNCYKSKTYTSTERFVQVHKDVNQFLQPMNELFACAGTKKVKIIKLLSSW